MKNSEKNYRCEGAFLVSKGVRCADVGEIKIIEAIRKIFGSSLDTLLPFNDDISAVLLSKYEPSDISHKDLALAINMDMMVAKTHVPKQMTPYQIGRKIIVMNVSDLVAKGAFPKYFLYSIGLPKDYPLDSVVAIAEGMRDASNEYNTEVIGGDTNECDELVISGIVLGFAHKDKLVPRSGAKIGDIVAVTGPFGYTGAGFKILLENVEAPANMKEIFIDSVLNPKSPYRVGLALASAGVLSASIDSSDGLASSLCKLGEQSQVAFEITKKERF